MGVEKKAPKISVIIPLYNCEEYIQDCIESLLSQTMQDFEVICVDDGSTDSSLARAKESCQGDQRFIFEILFENKGQSVARNKALEKASGDYVVLLDADDYLIPCALEKLSERADKQNLDELYFSARSFYESYEAHQAIREDYGDRISFDRVVSGKQLFTFFQTNHQFFPQAAFRMVKRSLIEENHIRFYEGIIHEDLLFTFQVFVVSKRASFLNEELYRRRVRKGSTMTSLARSLRSVQGHFIGITEMKKWLYRHADELEDDFVAAITQCMASFLLLASRTWFNNVDQKERTRYLLGLAPQERLSFYEEVIQRGASVIEAEEAYQKSKTYRLGDILLCGPRVVKDRINSILTFKNEQR